MGQCHIYMILKIWIWQGQEVLEEMEAHQCREKFAKDWQGPVLP